MNYKEFNKEVLYTTDAITAVNAGDMERLKAMAAGNPRKRIRLCCHDDVKNALHEMLIVHARGAYVQPHKHTAKSESFHIIKGKLNVVIFNNDGSILKVVQMGDQRSGKSFFYRLSKDYFHTVIPESKWVIFHETTNGPFRREDTVFAPWAPDEGDPGRTRVYLNKLEKEVKRKR
jgi:cupin fold WbuC family metalloprotein